MIIKLLVLLLLPMTTLATDLDLSYKSSSESFHQSNYQASAAHGSIVLAEARETRMLKERRKKREQTVMPMPVVVNEAKAQNSVIPAILGCGLLGLSLYGDSSAWKAGSAMACGFGLTYRFN